MAYLRKEEEKTEVSYPLGKVWKAINKALDALGWTTEEIDETSHRVRAKTGVGRTSWGSVLIEASPKGENATQVSALAATVVTTITAIIDFGKARRMINLFFEELSKQLS